jgi:ESS family glutamate:Na+ symporter
MLVIQNAVGVAAALSLDMHPLTGLLAGSITMSGGHGTGAAYATRFGEDYNLQGAMEIAMACATFGLVLGGLIGGPLAQRLIARHGLTASADADDDGAPGELGGDERRTLSPESFLETLFMIVICVMIGTYLGQILKNDYLTLPAFVWTLFTGVILRNGPSLSGLRQVDTATIDLLGTVSLSLFLAMALIALRLWELVSLALPILIILGAQTVAIAVYVYFVTFRVMDRTTTRRSCRRVIAASAWAPRPPPSPTCRRSRAATATRPRFS